MRIAVLGTRGFPNIQGGVESHCENLYPVLAGKGCGIIVFTRKPYSSSGPSEYKGVKLVPISCPKNKFLEAFIHTFKALIRAKKYKPDIVHIHAIGPSLFVPLAHLLGFKVVMTHHGPDYERKKWGKLAKIVLKIGETLGVKFSDQVIAISDYIAEGIKNKYNRSAVVIPNGAVIPKILTSKEALKKYGLDSRKYILAVGRFVPEKGFHDLIDAYNLLNEKNGKKQDSGYKLVIAGDADHEDAYSMALKEKAAKSKGVILTGFLKGVPLQELYSHAGLFVLASYYEGLPIVLLEALSYGVPCLASDIPQNKIINVEGCNFFKKGDILDLKEKMNIFIENICAAEENRERRVLYIKENYDWNKIGGRTLGVYNNVIKGA